MSEPTTEDLRSGRCTLPVTLEDTEIALLRGVRPDDAPALCRWREASHSWFFTESPAEQGRTHRWIERVVGTEDRVLLVIEIDGRAVGQVGLTDIDTDAGTAEIDNILRGESTPGQPGLMAAALRCLCAWADASLRIHQLRLRVFADNPAVAFYETLGFVADGEPSGLVFRGQPGDGGWEGAEPEDEPERFLMHMRRSGGW
jgi:diamine N-acetyltransferase